MGHRVTIAGGTNPIAQDLTERLGGGFEVRRVSPAVEPSERTWPADLTSISQAELACANTRTLVVLARTPRASSWRIRGNTDDLDRLVADSLARAALRCGVDHLVLFACGGPGDDVREPLLRASGLPTSVLRGGGPDPVEHLEALVRRGPGGDVEGPVWSTKPSKGRARRTGFTSVQRFPRPPGWSAEQLSQAYFRWLATSVPWVRVVSSADSETIFFLGLKVLVLRRLKGHAEPDSAVWEVTGGALAQPGGRLEIRVLLDGVSATMHLWGFRPTLPGPLYSFTQAFVHDRLIRRFGEFVGKRPSDPDVAAGPASGT
jgi:hypothetical protein